MAPRINITDVRNTEATVVSRRTIVEFEVILDVKLDQVMADVMNTWNIGIDGVTLTPSPNSTLIDVAVKAPDDDFDFRHLVRCIEKYVNDQIGEHDELLADAAKYAERAQSEIAAFLEARK